MSLDRVRGAYTDRAGEYIDLLGPIDTTAAEDQQLIAAWAKERTGAFWMWGADQDSGQTFSTPPVHR